VSENKGRDILRVGNKCAHMAVIFAANYLTRENSKEEWADVDGGKRCGK
jgi:hypothetical protein